MEQVMEAEKIDQILEVSEAAANKIAELIETRGKPGLAVRVAIRGKLPAGGYQTEFKFQDRAESNGAELVQPMGAFDFIFEPSVAEKIRGSKVDFNESKYTAGFNIEYPPDAYNQLPPELKEPKHWDDPLAQKVQDVITTYINPGVAGHGGWVLLKDFKGKDAYVEMGGGCQGCAVSAVTLRQGIERAIRQAAPEIDQIIDITAHEEGENPYYEAAPAEGAAASPIAK